MVTYLLFLNSGGLWLLGVKMIVYGHGIGSLSFDLGFLVLIDILDY